ncbi:response regulator transcription factor [Nonomuraea lactucae]|uniref:response regulator transcription factor n=1 Tax=Nonomuraea lactucae TaxID=2249762 RepID=UPI0013B3E598|nr:LuxR family transcriptional regulator [Nonomuraea lactucae]
MPPPAIQVAVHSPNRLLRESLAVALDQEPHLRSAGLTQNLPDLVRLCRLRPVDAILLDVDGGIDEVMESIPALRGHGIVLTYSNLTSREVVTASNAGLALVPYSRGITAVLEVIRRCPPRARTGRPPMLTDRDLEIVALAACGYNVKEMGRMLGIAPSTVENHMRRIFAKTNAHNRAHAVSLAARLGLLWRAPRPDAFTANLVIVFGPRGARRDAVVETLIRQAMPVMVAGDHWADDDLAMLVRKPVVAVLVDGSEDWQSIHALDARIVVVTDAAPGGLTPHCTAAVVPFQDVAQAVMLAAHRDRDARAAVRSTLTKRELEILRSIALGHSVRQTALALGITSKTVENIQARLFSKLSVRNRAEALPIAYELGLLSQES